jgi:hypothetical protein
VKNTSSLSPFQSALITFLLGSVTCGWSMIILPHALASGYLPASFMGLLPSLVLVNGPFFLSLYAAMILSGSTSWNGSVIGEKQKSLALFFRYLNILILGASLTGLACSGFRLVTSESVRTTYIYTFTGPSFLFGVLLSLWSPKGGILRKK